MALILAGLAVVLQNVGVDIDLGSPDVGEAGWSLMELVAWLFGLAAAYFRTKATTVTNAFGFKTSAHLK